MHVHNTLEASISGGQTVMVLGFYIRSFQYSNSQTTQGYGCMLFFCGWQDGPVIDLPTCQYNGVQCDASGNILAPHQEATIVVDFVAAITQAKATSGCCV
jgi:hypothetical protein